MHQNQSIMQKIFLVLALFFLNLAASSQEKNEEIIVKNVIDTFFEGLHKGDSAIVSKTLHKNVKIQTINTSKEGTKMLKDDKKIHFNSIFFKTN